MQFQLAVGTVHVDVLVVIVIGGGFIAEWWCASRSGVLAAAPNIQQVCGGSHDEGHGDEKCSCRYHFYISSNQDEPTKIVIRRWILLARVKVRIYPTAATSVAFRAYEIRLSKRLKKKVTIRHKVQFQCYFIIETNSNVRMYKSRSQPGLSIMLWKLECDKSPRESQITKLLENSKTSLFISAEKAAKLAFQQSRPAAAISHSEAERESSTARLTESPPPYVTRTRTCPQATQDGGQVARD